MAIECKLWHVGPPMKKNFDGHWYLVCSECNCLISTDARHRLLRMHQTYAKYIEPLKRGEYARLPPKLPPKEKA